MFEKVIGHIQGRPIKFLCYSPACCSGAKEGSITGPTAMVTLKCVQNQSAVEKKKKKKGLCSSSTEDMLSSWDQADQLQHPC